MHGRGLRVAFAVAAAIYFDLLGRPRKTARPSSRSSRGCPSGTLQVDLAFLADPLSILMCLFITFIAGWIHMFAVGVHARRRQASAKLFRDLDRFVGHRCSMPGARIENSAGRHVLDALVDGSRVPARTCRSASGSTRDSAAAAVHRSAFDDEPGGGRDWGAHGCRDVPDRSRAAGTNAARIPVPGRRAWPRLRRDVADLAAATRRSRRRCCLIGAAGKSAQLPLLLLAASAMMDGGPTPVSALDSTTVDGWPVAVSPADAPAGTRSIAVWSTHAGRRPRSRGSVAITASVRGDAIASAQDDIKTVLGDSNRVADAARRMLRARHRRVRGGDLRTWSPHAGFKALLFLGAGSVIHGMHDEQDMCFTVPALVHADHRGDVHRRLAGDRRDRAARFSGFWSRDEILLVVRRRRATALVRRSWIRHGRSASAFDMTRQVVMAFFGERGPGTSLADAEEAPDSRRGRTAGRDPQRGRGIQAARACHRSCGIPLMARCAPGSLRSADPTMFRKICLGDPREASPPSSRRPARIIG